LDPCLVLLCDSSIFCTKIDKFHVRVAQPAVLDAGLVTVVDIAEAVVVLDVVEWFEDTVVDRSLVAVPAVVIDDDVNHEILEYKSVVIDVFACTINIPCLCRAELWPKP